MCLGGRSQLIFVACFWNFSWWWPECGVKGGEVLAGVVFTWHGVVRDLQQKGSAERGLHTYVYMFMNDDDYEVDRKQNMPSLLLRFYVSRFAVTVTTDRHQSRNACTV